MVHAIVLGVILKLGTRPTVLCIINAFMSIITAATGEKPTGGRAKTAGQLALSNGICRETSKSHPILIKIGQNV